MPQVKLMTRPEYAAHRGVSEVAVHKAIKAQRISVDRDGMIDPVVADIQWAQNTRARTRNVTSKPAPPPGPAADLVDQAAAPSADGQPAAAPPPAAAAVPDGYTAARARRELADAETAEIQLKKLRGELLVGADVAKAGYEIGREIRDSMEAAVSSQAAELAQLHTADECAVVLRKQNRAMQDLLVKTFREKIGLTSVGDA